MSIPDFGKTRGYAPTEGHLENWIAANLETVATADSQLMCNYSLIGQQMVLPSGRLDLLFSRTYMYAHGEGEPYRQIFIAEIKKGGLDSSALLQVLRYRSDLKMIWREAGGYNMPPVKCILIGYDIPDKVLIAAHGADVKVMLYEYHPTPNRYDLIERNPMHTIKERYFGDYADTALADLMRDMWREMGGE